jgi:uncharacterized glyoxalase superfamily protein PhnB
MSVPYLFFDGRCEQAVEFYRTALGAEVQHLARYSDSPEPLPPGMVPDGWGDKVMHASLSIRGQPLMACDSARDPAARLPQQCGDRHANCCCLLELQQTLIDQVISYMR